MSPLERAFIPYGAYWSTPFCRWQGSLAGEHSIELAARVAVRALAARKLAPEAFDEILLGLTVPQRSAFYGAPWAAGLLGAPGITGPTLSQACATSARVLATAAFEIEAKQRDCVLGLTCDRTSNGPHVYYPNPLGAGGTGESENTVLDSFAKDPFAGSAMLATAENVAREAKIGREEQESVTLLRYEQYASALADDRAFQRRYMVPVELGRGKKAVVIDADEGVHPTTRDGLAKLAPVMEGGSVTYGTQTHPADGNAGVVVCSRARADALSRDPKVVVQLVSFADARVKKAFMPMAVVPAARRALDIAGIGIADCRAIKTHNPFALNDVYFAREMGVAPDKMNHYGSPLVWGHPQAPMGTRAVAELIEELVILGGGYGLFSGCAAGDTAMAVVLKVS